MRTKLSLKAKLLSLAAFTGLCSIASAGFALYSMEKVESTLEIAHSGGVPKAIELAKMNTAALDSVRYVAQAMLSETPEQLTRRVGEVEKALDAYKASFASYKSLPVVPAEQALSDKLDQSWGGFENPIRQMVEVLKSSDEDKMQIAKQLMNGSIKPRQAFVAEMKALADFTFKTLNEEVDQAIATSESGKMTNLTFAILAALTGFGIAWLLSSNLAKNLMQLARDLSTGADDVAVTSKQISSSSAQLSSAASEQAAALQETVSSIEEISAMVNKNAEGAKESQTMSANSSTAAGRGQQTVQEMQQALDEISASNQEIVAQIELSNKEMHSIVKVIAEIGEKTKVINEIVFQTKLLSFNASVEAARAGEHGKGFAVVAEEVGGLAQMSGNAANEISTMLNASMERVESMVKQTQARVEGLIQVNKAKTQAGSSKAQDCASILQEIVGDVESVNQMVGEIALASREQAQGVHEITQAMSQMDQVTQQNATISQESASASEQLSKRADSLRHSVEELMQTVRGHKAAALPGNSKKQTAAPVASNVIAMTKTPKAAPVSIPAPVLKKAVGANVPSENDPRFQDV